MKIHEKRNTVRRTAALLLAAALTAATAGAVPQLLPAAEAKTQNSTPAETVFFYSKDDSGKDVLIKIMSIDELSELSHGDTGENGQETDYFFSSTDNYPTTQYCQARGFTIPELVEYVKKNSSVKGAENLTYTGGDIMKFMATDSYGTYSHARTWQDLYGTDRYYFEDLYDEKTGWNTGWEIAGEENSKSGMSLDEYNGSYKADDSYYDAKRSVFETGRKTETILAVESYSGRTASESLTASTEPGLAGYIAENGGKVTDCLKGKLENTWSLRLCIPMSEADLMSAHRTAYDNFKWVYNVCLDMEKSGAPASQGTVAAPQASYSTSTDGKTLTVTLSCETPGASIYWSLSDAPQTLYTGPVKIDISGRELSSNPVTFYMTAVKEGWDDAGVITEKYPQTGVSFKTLYSAMTDSDITFEADSGVTQQAWNDWTSAIIGISVKKPDSSGYEPLASSEYTIDKTGRKIIINKSAVSGAGAYSFAFYAKGFANKTVSLSIKKAAPEVGDITAAAGTDIEISFSDDSYRNGLYIYVSDSVSGESSVISPSYTDRTLEGKVIIKKEYFDSPSCAIKEPGTYTLELVNNSCTPSSQKIKLTVTGEAGAPGGSGFRDVSTSDWYGKAVDYVTSAGYFSGTSNDTFSPDKGMTRGMFVTVLGRMASAGTSAASGFTDVSADKYYAPYVGWAAENGIVSGTGGGLFSPDSGVTREQMAVIMYNYMKYTGKEPSSDRTRYDSFSDTGSVSPWAQEALIWASGEEIINGSSGRLNPRGKATRAQVAQIIMNFCEKISDESNK